VPILRLLKVAGFQAPIPGWFWAPADTRGAGGTPATGVPVRHRQQSAAAGGHVGHHLHSGPREGAGPDQRL